MTRRHFAVVSAEIISVAALVAILLPALRTSGITSFGVWFLAGAGIAIHTMGHFEAGRTATVVSLLSAATFWAVVHVDGGGGIRHVVVVGLLLWVSEESRDLSLTLRRPGHRPGAVTAARLPRYLGVTAAALAADVALVAVLRDPPVSGWIWRIVGAGALMTLLVAARPRASTGS